MNSRLDWLVLSDYYSIYVIKNYSFHKKTAFSGGFGFFGVEFALFFVLKMSDVA